MDIKRQLPPKPIPPNSQLIREDRRYNSGCPICGSSFSKKSIFFQSKHCIQPKCNNYFGNFDKGE